MAKVLVAWHEIPDETFFIHMENVSAEDVVKLRSWHGKYINGQNGECEYDPEDDEVENGSDDDSDDDSDDGPLAPEEKSISDQIYDYFHDANEKMKFTTLTEPIENERYDLIVVTGIFL